MLITASEIIKKSWETYSKNWKVFLPYMISLFTTSLTLGLVGILGLTIEKFLHRGSLVFINNLFIATLTVALLLLTLWLTIALTKALKSFVEKKDIETLKENLHQTGKYLWPVIWTSFLMFLAIIGGFVLFIIPAIIFAIWFSFYFYIVLFEDKTGVAALKNSRDLVVGRWWRILWLLIAPGIFYGVIVLVLQGTFTYPLSFIFEEGNLVTLFIRSFFNTAFSALFAPLSALITLYLYLSAKENPVEKIPETPEKI